MALLRRLPVFEAVPGARNPDSKGTECGEARRQRDHRPGKHCKRFNKHF